VDSDSSTHSFVVKIWLEQPADETGPARWRGHITHVPSGHRRYLTTLTDVAGFIAPYLRQLGIWPGRSRGWRWWPFRRTP
jgi:hypothetical protein